MSLQAKVYRWRWWLLGVALITLLPFFAYLFVALTPDAPEPDDGDLALRFGAGEADADTPLLGDRVGQATVRLRAASEDFSNDALLRLQAWFSDDFSEWDAALAERYLEANAETLSQFEAIALDADARFGVDAVLLDPRDTEALFGLTGLQRLRVTHALRTDQAEVALVELGLLSFWTSRLMQGGCDMVRVAASFDAHEQSIEAMLEVAAVLSEEPDFDEAWVSLIGVLSSRERQLFRPRALFADVMRGEYHQRRLLLAAIVRGDEISWMSPQEGQAMRTLHGAGLFKPNAAQLELVRAYRALLERWERLAGEAVLPENLAEAPYAVPGSSPRFLELATSLNPGGLYYMRRAGALLPQAEFLEAWRRLGIFQIRSAQIELAARAYQADHEGALPPDLAALVPDYLETVPQDPFALDERPLRYDGAAGQIASVGIDAQADATLFPVVLDRGDVQERLNLRRRLREPLRVLLASPGETGP
ncbi:MAG: hypothetical protein ACFB20_00155 [Opitutales bacterium]